MSTSIERQNANEFGSSIAAGWSMDVCMSSRHSHAFQKMKKKSVKSLPTPTFFVMKNAKHHPLLSHECNECNFIFCDKKNIMCNMMAMIKKQH